MKIIHFLDKIQSILKESNNLNSNIELIDEDNWVYDIKDIRININEDNKLSFKIELIGEKFIESGATS